MHCGKRTPVLRDPLREPFGFRRYVFHVSGRRSPVHTTELAARAVAERPPSRVQASSTGVAGPPAHTTRWSLLSTRLAEAISTAPRLPTS
jgi:hypothetical protein